MCYIQSMHRSIKLLLKKITKKQLYIVLVLAFGTGLMAAVLSFSFEDEKEKSEKGPVLTPSEIASDSKLLAESSTEAQSGEAEKEEEEEYVPSIDNLNLAYFYPEGAEREDQLNSYAGEIYKDLMKRDNDYLARIFDTSGMSPVTLARRLGVSSSKVMGKYNPREASQEPEDPSTWYIPVFKNVNMAFYNADGKRINECSNVKDIMAMASVYCYSHDSMDPEAFKTYCEEIYKKSKSYSVSIGNVYYCDGCINRSAKEEAEDFKKMDKAFSVLKQYLAASMLTPETEAEMTDIDKASPADALDTEAVTTGALDAASIESSSGTTDHSGNIESESSENGDLLQSSQVAGASRKSAYEGTYEKNSSDAANAESSQSDDSAVIFDVDADSQEIMEAVIPQQIVYESQALESNAISLEDAVCFDVEVAADTGNVNNTGGIPSAEAAGAADTVSETAKESGEASLQDSIADLSGNSEAASENAESTSVQNSEGENTGTQASYEGGDQDASLVDRDKDEDSADEKDMNSESETDTAVASQTKVSDRIVKTILGRYSKAELLMMDDSTLRNLIEEAYRDAESKRDSNAETDVKSKKYCPGHVDLYVRVNISGFEDKKGLRSIKISTDPFKDTEDGTSDKSAESAESKASEDKDSKEKTKTSKDKSKDGKADKEETADVKAKATDDKKDRDDSAKGKTSGEEGDRETQESETKALNEKTWNGWTEDKISAVQKLISMDWYKAYGFSISTIDPKNPLTEEEISRYLDGLPDDISADRKKVIRFALESVGKVPYYYGGKASAKGYEANHFGSFISQPDHRGRIFRGLDCSGWIHWVYWTAIGNNLDGACSTSTLVGEGEKIKRADLQPGDIIIREGADSHVVMFLQWVGNGNMIAIHENGSANNVSVNEVTASYPYYRKLIN